MRSANWRKEHKVEETLHDDHDDDRDYDDHDDVYVDHDHDHDHDDRDDDHDDDDSHDYHDDVKYKNLVQIFTINSQLQFVIL